MDRTNGFALAAVTFLLTLAFGFWLNRKGRPYPGLLFNLHKLIALAAVVLAVLQLTGAFNGIEEQGLVIVALGLAGGSVAALFTSGALMSAGKLEYATMHVIHRLGWIGATLALAFTAYILHSGW
jgi:hypothetical protein